jgi:hypothetical protein
MNIVLLALSVAVAAFCVWLGVRIYNRRERWAKRMAVGLAICLPAFYVLSFGPACWLISYNKLPMLETARVYHPLVRVAASNRGFSSGVLRRYSELGERGFPIGERMELNGITVCTMSVLLDVFD